jgi:hypothetical protein
VPRLCSSIHPMLQAVSPDMVAYRCWKTQLSLKSITGATIITPHSYRRSISRSIPPRQNIKIRRHLTSISLVGPSSSVLVMTLMSSVMDPSSQVSLRGLRLPFHRQDGDKLATRISLLAQKH